MDDKQLNELMQEYLNSRLKGDKEKDLSKFNQIEIKRKPSIFKSKIFYATLSCVMVFIICLSIALPLILNGRNGGTDIRYYDDAEINYIENLNDDLYVNFESDVLKPQVISMYSVGYDIYINENDLFIGIKSDIYVYDENFDLLNFYILNKQSKLNFLEQQMFDNITQWQETEVKWKLNEESAKYVYIFCFEKGNYFYYYTIETVNLFEINNLLNILFV